MVQQQDIKSFARTLVIGVGGTGLEVITRIRRLIVESYGSLANFPVISFLHIDTEENYQVKDKNMAGPALETSEKFWSKVKYEDAEDIVKNKSNYSWYHEWLPPELTPEQLTCQEGAGQIRACGRFSFFHNRDDIKQKCQEAKNRITNNAQVTIGNEIFPIKPKLNIFVVASISGGTGSGMLIDFGYSLRDWFQGENHLELTAIVPSPDAFTGVGAGLRLKENGYAALMELNYFYDANTEYSVKFGPYESDRVTQQRPPYDFMYVVGTQNQLVTIEIKQIREMIAQNIFLDLVSDFSAYKRTVRDNIKSQISQVTDQPIDEESEPVGRSYPRNFYSFGISSIEIPIHQIRKYLSSRLTSELYQWWLKAQVKLPSDMTVEVEQELRELKLLTEQIRGEVLISADGPRFEQKVQQWIKSLEAEIIRDHRLQCTAQLPNIPPFVQEKGKILEFNRYLDDKVQEFRLENFRDDQRKRGQYIERMYNNKEQLIIRAMNDLEQKVYLYLLDSSRGSQLLQAFLQETEQNFNRQIEKLEREASKTWEVVEKANLEKYTKALSSIQEFCTRWSATKESDMKRYCDDALQALETSLQAGLQRQSRQITAEVLRRLVQTVQDLKIRLDRWIGQIQASSAKYKKLAKEEENQVEILEFVGLKLFQRLELQELYSDFCTVRNGQEVLFQQLTQQIVQQTQQEKFWTQSHGNQSFQLFDVEKIDNIQYPQFEQLVDQISQQAIKDAPANSKLAQDLDACNRFMKLYPDPSDQQREIGLLFNRSKPLVRLEPNIPKGRFQYIELHLAGVFGGENTSEPAAQKQVELLKKFFTQKEAIAPLSNRERHKLLAVHEVGGFSLRCLAGTKILRKEYQKWRGERIRTERAILKGQKQEKDLPIPVHLQKDMVFWDLVPPDSTLDKLVLVSRVFGLLREEINQKTQKSVIRYRKKTELGEDVITLSSSWEDAIQVLELPDCREDRTEIEHQLEELLEKAETKPQKQQLRKQMEDFLKERLETVYRKIGADDPLYLRERTIIQEFITEHKLGTNINPTPPQLTATTDHKLGFSVSDQPQPPSNRAVEVEYEQYLTQLSGIGMPEEALQISAKNKANQLNLSQEVSDRILNRFLNS